MNSLSSINTKSELRLRSEIIVPPQSTVILIHGLASKRFDMSLFAYRLRKFGYNVVNWGYPSIRKSNSDHGRALANRLSAVDLAGRSDHRVHIVAHSMGCIVTRCALLEFLPDNIGRVVMLAPPNGGSFVARKLTPWLGWLSTTLVELSDDPDSFVNQLPPIKGVQCGVLAASRDRVIERSRTRLAGEADFAIVETGHGVMPWNREAVDQTHRFLTLGKFKKI
ncbi:MAG: alpha/beta hydrolase [Planctomycetota bacterium]